jgi:hypothetical protein
MTKRMLSRLVLVAMTVLALQRVEASSAVANDGHGHTVYSTGQPTKAIAIQHALLTARQRYGTDARIVAATDVTGYSAIAVARKGRGSILGITLGRPSQADADNRAIGKCLKAGGTDVQVRWRFNG